MAVLLFRRLCALPLLLALLLAADPAAAAAKRKARAVFVPPYAAVVVDAADGTVLHEENADAMRHPASLTKMMTLYLLFEAIENGRVRMATAFPVSARAADQDPTKLGLKPGDTLTARDAILGLVTKSANDAAVVVAEALAGSEERFAERMTAKARRLGMTRTTFQNASGLPDPEQETTARDMARLARALLRDFPQHYHFFSAASFNYAGVTHANHNRFMNWYEGADGLKTGFIRASGFNLVASAQRGERRLVGVVMGGTSAGARDQRMGEILDAAFTQRPALPSLRQANAAPPAPRASNGAFPAAAAATPPPAAQPAVSGAWGVQVGAFADAAQARHAAERARLAAPQLARAAIEVSPGGQKHKLVRARLVGVTAEEARAACQAMQRRKLACFPVSPAELGPVRSVQF